MGGAENEAQLVIRRQSLFVRVGIRSQFHIVAKRPIGPECEVRMLSADNGKDSTGLSSRGVCLTNYR